MYMKTITVSALNNYIKRVLDNDIILSNSSIKGEISNFKLHTSGHIYFSLKDEFSKINCVMFRSSAKNLKFVPENGMKVIVKGRISVYEKDGAYQLYCNEIELEGVGELYIAFEKLKNKLREEGLFEEKHKINIPTYAKKIGIVTSPTGAAIRDIINVTKRRNRNVELLIYPAVVQGINASSSIIKGIECLNKIEDLDIIILARGGGSIEELWCFNDEQLAYAVYNSKKPIITGVGHEIDYTIVDFVSDRRAPTPSAAAEIAVFNAEETKNKILYNKHRMISIMNLRLSKEKNMLDVIHKELDANSPAVYIVNQYNNIDNLKHLLDVKIKVNMEKEKEKLGKINSLLYAHNPLNILNKGYSIIEEKGKVVSSMKNLKELDEVKIVLKDGEEKFKLKWLES